MDTLVFEWDARKATANEAKHGVTFAEAESCFYDEFALVIPNPDHSESEERFILMGLSSMAELLLIVHAFKHAQGTIRLISARRASNREATAYEERRNAIRI